MRNIATMAQRELGAYFLSPIAYAVAAIFLFSSGLAFGLETFRSGYEVSLKTFLHPWMMIILTFVLPMLTMRLMSEELRSGTIETLMTVPITELEVILGKFFGALSFFVILLAVLLIYPIVLAAYGTIDVLLLVCHGLAVLLLGSLYIAVGLFFSTCTKHQVVAVLLGSTLLALMAYAAQGLSGKVEGWLRAMMQQLSVQTHFMDLVRGMLTVNHLLFFLSTTAVFLFLSVKRLEMRRWQ